MVSPGLFLLEGVPISKLSAPIHVLKRRIGIAHDFSHEELALGEKAARYAEKTTAPLGPVVMTAVKKQHMAEFLLGRHADASREQGSLQLWSE